MHYCQLTNAPGLLVACRHCEEQPKDSPLYTFMFGKSQAKRAGGGFWQEYGLQPDWLQAHATVAGVRAVNNGLENHHRQLKAKFNHKMEPVRGV